MTTVQAYSCIKHYPNDSKYIRWTVVILWVMETVHTGVNIDSLYESLIAGFGNPVAIVEIHWSTGSTMPLALIIITIVHGFFIHRIWVLSEHSICAVMVPSSLVLANVVFSIVMTVYLFKFDTWIAFRAHETASATVYVVTTLLAAVDLVTTTTLIYYLYKHRSAYHTSNHLLQKVGIYVINSGAMTIAASMSVLFTFALMRNSFLFVGLQQTLCKLYNNALLATLNARNTARDMRPVYQSTALPEFSFREDVSRRDPVSLPATFDLSARAGDRSVESGPTRGK